MIVDNDAVLLTASDLTVASNCEWQLLASLDHKLGLRDKPPSDEDAMLARTAELGDRHEERILAALKQQGEVVEIEKGFDAEGRAAAIAATRAAVERGAPVIFQAAFGGDRFFGYADFIELDEHGEYVVSDAKLARRAKVTALLQLAAYARALRELGAPVSDEVRLLLGDGQVSEHRLRDIEPVFVERRARLERLVDERRTVRSRLEWGVAGIAACGQCAVCAEEIEAHDDVFRIAGIRRDQRDRLRASGISTVAELAASDGRPADMAIGTFRTLQRQARLQQASLAAGRTEFELIDAGAILDLPAPTPGDLFFDFEGDPLWQDGAVWGLDYLFGVRDISAEFTGFWAHTLVEERKALLDFLDFVRARRAAHPDLRVYHYAAYERTHLASLAARHGVGEQEVDEMLRTGVLVDLYPVVKRALAVGSESYSLKKLEPLYMPAERTQDVANAGDSIVWFQRATEMRALGDQAGADALLKQIEEYNAYDVESTHRLRDWLLSLVPGTAEDVQREVRVPKELTPERAEVVAAREELVERLLARAGDDPAHRDAEETALWLAAAAIGYHSRESKAFWWEHYRRLDEPLGEWRDQRDVVTIDEVLEEGAWAREKESIVRRIRFRGTAAPGSRVGVESDGWFAVYEPPTTIDPDRTTRLAAHAKTALTFDGEVFELRESAGRHQIAQPWGGLPIALAPSAPPGWFSLADSISAWADRVASAVAVDTSLVEALPADAPLDVLRRRPPSALAPVEAEDTIGAIVASLADLDAPFVAVQGPPGTGKTRTGAHVIAELVRRGWRIGVVAQSHTTVENMLDGILDKTELPASMIHKRPKDGDKRPQRWNVTQKPFDSLGAAPGVVGGTAWTFAGHANNGGAPLDLLVIDEAGQFSLANTIAAGRAARRLLLLGDPQQLPQVSQGTHPAPVDGSALGWLCDGRAVIPREYGYFLGTTWRMQPELTEAVSELAYDGQLDTHIHERSLAGVEAGLHSIPVAHLGNSTHSSEEADAVVATVRNLVGREWRDGDASRPLTAADVIVVAPYNAQVAELHHALTVAGFADASVGTVDRFQGREAAVVIVSMAASSAEDVPRGADFLLSTNRLNVAISRGKWCAFLVHSPGLRGHLPATPAGVAQLSAFLRLADA